MKYLFVCISLAFLWSCSNQDINKSSTISSKEDFLLVGETVAIEKKELVQAEENGQYCIVSYTVTAEGLTKDIKVVDCPNEIFIRVSLEAAKKFRYKPKVVNGKAVEVQGVKNKFTFTLADDN